MQYALCMKHFYNIRNSKFFIIHNFLTNNNSFILYLRKITMLYSHLFSTLHARTFLRTFVYFVLLLTLASNRSSATNGSISGMVFNDQTNFGVKDPTDPGLAVG